jgi:hypothetical protein
MPVSSVRSPPTAGGHRQEFPRLSVSSERHRIRAGCHRRHRSPSVRRRAGRAVVRKRPALGYHREAIAWPARPSSVLPWLSIFRSSGRTGGAHPAHWYSPIWKTHYFKRIPGNTRYYRSSRPWPAIMQRSSAASFCGNRPYTPPTVPGLAARVASNILHLVAKRRWARSGLSVTGAAKDGLGMNECPRDCPQIECIPCSFYGNVPVVYSSQSWRYPLSRIQGVPVSRRCSTLGIWRVYVRRRRRLPGHGWH